MFKTLIPAMMAAATLFAASTATQAAPTLQVGNLQCNLASETNYVLYSQGSYDCTFTNAAGDTAEFTGTIDKVGVDLSYDLQQQINWLVLAPSFQDAADSISGTYAGTSTDASLGAGFGTRFMLGGSGDQVTLQPIAVSGHFGAGAAVGLDRFTLAAR